MGLVVSTVPVPGIRSGRLYTGQDGRRWRFVDLAAEPAQPIQWAVVRRADPKWSEEAVCLIVVPWAEWSHPAEAGEPKSEFGRRAPRFSAWCEE